MHASSFGKPYSNECWVCNGNTEPVHRGVANWLIIGGHHFARGFVQEGPQMELVPHHFEEDPLNQITKPCQFFPAIDLSPSHLAMLSSG